MNEYNKGETNSGREKKLVVVSGEREAGEQMRGGDSGCNKKNEFVQWSNIQPREHRLCFIITANGA